MGGFVEGYAATLEETARVKAGGESWLRLTDDRFHGLHRIPPEVTELTNLRTIRLDKTQVSDLSPSLRSRT